MVFVFIFLSFFFGPFEYTNDRSSARLFKSAHYFSSSFGI